MPYVSKEVPILSDEDLKNISISSSANNEKNQITGTLLYMDREFLQILEGPEKGLLETYQRIDMDTRHNSVNLYCQGPIEKRAFTQWEMQDAVKFPERTGFGTFTEFFQKTSDDKIMEMGVMLAKEFAIVISE